ncbi:MAG: restriction endonuclease subunit S [Candidatus Izemoplasmatales bacterium]
MMINTQAIRRHIIDLAIQGKLSNEGSCDWDNVSLSDITTPDYLNDGDWILSEDMVAYGDVKLIQLGSIGDNVFKQKNFKFITSQRFEELKCSEIRPGYLLINRLVNGNMMLSCLVPNIEGKLITSVDACWIAPNNNIYNLTYIMYAISSTQFQKKVKELGRGVTRFRISKKNLISISFPFPPLEEQKRIVAKLDEIFAELDKIDEKQTRLATIQEKMEAKILKLAIQGKLVEQRPEEGTGEELFKLIQKEKQELIKQGKIKKEKHLPVIEDDEIPFEIPSTWKWVRLGEIIQIKSGEMLTSSEMKNGLIPVYGGNGVAGYHDKWLVDEETIVIGRVGFYCGSVHITEKYAWITDNAFITHYSKSYINQKYLAFILKQMNLGGKNNGVAQPVVSGKKIYPMFFPLPPLEEQKRIVAKIEELLPLCKG